MSRLILVLLLVGLCPFFSVLADAARCRVDWNTWYEEEASEARAYREAIEEAFSPEVKARCRRGLGSVDNSTTTVSVDSYMGEVDLRQIEDLAELATRDNGLAKFSYRVIPPRSSAVGGIVRLPGGPGATLSAIPAERLQMEDKIVVTIDDLGVGSNQFGIEFDDERFITLDVTARVVEQIVSQEFPEELPYSIAGASYASISATVIGSYLSQTTRPPSAVVVSAVAGDAEILTRRNGILMDLKAGFEARFINGNWCMVPARSSCYDDRVLALLGAEERSRYHELVNALFDSNRMTVKRLFRDAFHWEYLGGERASLLFVRNYVLQASDFDRLYCWYLRFFDDIPWVNRYRSASHLANVKTLNCYSIPKRRPPRLPDIVRGGSQFHCACLEGGGTFDIEEHQVDVAMLYANSDSDSQTPIEEAIAAYCKQPGSSKAFLTICGAGHSVIRPNPQGTIRAADTETVFRYAFNGNLAAFRDLENYCSAGEEEELAQLMSCAEK